MAVPSTFSDKFTTAMNVQHPGYEFEVALAGRKFDRISVTNRKFTSRSTHAFIERSTGDIYKSAGKAPAAGVRFHAPDDSTLSAIVAQSDPYGSYLYIR